MRQMNCNQLTRLASVCIPTQLLTKLLPIVQRYYHNWTKWSEWNVLRTDIDAFVRGAILNDEVVHLPVAEHRRPVDRVRVTQTWVSLDTDRTADDPSQVTDAQLFKIRHLEHHQRVVVEQRLSADRDQVRKYVTQRVHAVDSIQQQVVRDFSQVRKRKMLKLLGPRVVHQQDLQVSLYDGAVL